MKKVFNSLFFLVVILSCGGVGYITPEELYSGITDNHPVIVDIRERKKYADGHINGAVNAEYNHPAFLPLLSGIDKNSDIIIYCGEGIKSDPAAEILKKNGFEQIRILKGGYSEWIKQGYQVVQ